MRGARRFAVVGAGVSGLACARRLVERGHDVAVFDKGRGVGGRLATRRVGDHAFDLGAPCFAADEPTFVAWVERLARDGACARWDAPSATVHDEGDAVRLEPGREERRWVGTPSMSAFGKALASGLDVGTSHRVETIERTPGGVRLRGSRAEAGVTLAPASASTEGALDLGTYDRVLVCLPAPQATELVRPIAEDLAARLAEVAMAPCFSIGLVFEGEDAATLAALPNAILEMAPSGTPSPLARALRDSGKPGRALGERWVLHATHAFSRTHAPGEDAEVVRAVGDAFARCVGRSRLTPTTTVVRRWALARTEGARQDDVLVDDAAGLGVAGEFLGDGTIEAAFLAGCRLASHVA